MYGQWRKLGLVFNASGQADWMCSHAALPVAEYITGDLFRVYFSPRDQENRGHIASLVMDIGKDGQVLELSTTPVLSPGALGTFDDSGATMGWLTRWNGLQYLYYSGWNLGVTVPFRFSLGLCISNDGENYTRYATGPIMDRLPHEPFLIAAGCILVDDGVWKIWYPSCTRWCFFNDNPKHYYHIKYAESNDGIHWQRDGIVAIDYSNNDEYAFSRPSVIHDADKWRMWYAYRGEKYKIGYAESIDGVSWQRKDADAGIDVSTSGWDSEMIEYPFVFDHKGRRYMLYNGNEYGRTGFGLAVWEA
ncbi:MAG: hypothetical protein LBV02_02955 [Bacteroidales bacterium]|jgi:hypothetical protein|nr:hypothetical protein [Bacteroidales bacterium]